MKATIIAVLILVASMAWAGDQPVISKETVENFYRVFKKLNKQPRRVESEAQYTDLCVGIISEKDLVGPHGEKKLNLYANSKAADSIAPKDGEPLLGLAIAKEKLENDVKLENEVKLLNIFANPKAVDSIAAKDGEFPVGAVIVKEKLGDDGVVTGIGGMVKRPNGFDPANGNWEYFYYSPNGGFSIGKLANCIDCHKNGKRDHVFSVWNL